MKAANKVAAGLILLGIAATAVFEIGRYRARTDIQAAAAGFRREYSWACGPPEEMKIGPSRWCTICQARNGGGRCSLWMS